MSTVVVTVWCAVAVALAASIVSTGRSVVASPRPGGTIFLVIFITLFATVAAGVFQLLRRWLPRHSLGTGMVAWLAALLCVGVILLG